MAAKNKSARTRTKVQPGGETFERTYKGKLHKVTATPDGFRYGRKTYASLTAVAKEVTGYKAVSGPRFFGVDAASQKKGGTK